MPTGQFHRICRASSQTLTTPVKKPRSSVRETRSQDIGFVAGRRVYRPITPSIAATTVQMAV